MGESARWAPEVAAYAGLPPRGGPTVLRIMLGAQLRRLREARGVSAEDAGDAIRASQSKISRLEMGRVGFKERDIADLLVLYGVTDEAEREALLALARQSNAPGWWHRYYDVLPSWFETYIGLEEAAKAVHRFETRHIPDLLQTREYAGAVAVLGREEIPPGDLERLIDFKMRRQRLLRESGAPRLMFVIDEAVLRRPLGDKGMMRAQLEHLLEVDDLPNVTLHILSSGTARREGGSFSILQFAEESLPEIVYIEHLNSALYLDKAADVDIYMAELERLFFDAAPLADTRRIIREVIAELNH